MRWRIVIAPDGFKETLSAEQACAAMAEGVGRVLPDAEMVCLPLADGGEGTVAALLSAGGRRHKAEVIGPLGDLVSAEFGVMADGRTAVVEMSAASGFELLGDRQRDPLGTTTYGTGQLIAAAHGAIASGGAGAARIIVGVGGSATVDGGCGALQALGARFLDQAGKTITEHLCGGMLDRIGHVDTEGVDADLLATEVAVACDVVNPLCGPDGAARVFAPQKGASAEGVALLERNLEHLAAVFERDLGVRVHDLPRAGAAGGLAAGLCAALGARLVSGAALIMEALEFAERVAGADLIITGEGQLDHTSLGGKVVMRVAEEGQRLGIPVVALVGSTGEGADRAAALLDGLHTLANDRVPVEEAKKRAASRLAEVAEEAVRARL